MPRFSSLRMRNPLAIPCSEIKIAMIKTLTKIRGTKYGELSNKCMEWNAAANRIAL